MTRPPLELLAEQWDAWGADLDPVLDDVGDLAAASARRICAAQLREALRAQAETDRGLREAVAQLMSDPWSYHEMGARCIDCGRLSINSHSDDCAVVKIRAFIAQDEMRAALAQPSVGGSQ